MKRHSRSAFQCCCFSTSVRPIEISRLREQQQQKHYKAFEARLSAFVTVKGKFQGFVIFYLRVVEDGHTVIQFSGFLGETKLSGFGLELFLFFSNDKAALWLIIRGGGGKWPDNFI